MSAVDAVRVVELSTWSSGRESHIKAYFKFVCIFWKYVHSVGSSSVRSKYTNVYVYINWINAFRFPWFIITYYINFYLAAHTHTLTHIHFNLIEMQKNKRKSAKEERTGQSARWFVCVRVCVRVKNTWLAHRNVEFKEKCKCACMRACACACTSKIYAAAFPFAMYACCILSDVVRIVRVCTLNLDGNQVKNGKRPAKM